MKTKLLTIAMTAALMLTAMTKVQAQNFEGPCLPYAHGLNVHVTAFCGSTVTQTIALLAGVNWFSTYVDITLDDLQNALATATPDKAITIKFQNANSIYAPRTHKWTTGSGFTWNVANMYQIIMAEACEITLEGMSIDPAAHSITIAGGVTTWIGFPFSEAMTVTNAFATLPPTNGDNVKYQNSNAIFSRNKWSSGITNLEPGKGYQYISAPNSADRVLTFPSSNK